MDPREQLAQLLMQQQQPSQNIQPAAGWRQFMAANMMNIPTIDTQPNQMPAPLPGALGDLSRSVDSYYPKALAAMQARGGRPQQNYVFPEAWEDPMPPPPVPHR